MDRKTVAIGAVALCSFVGIVHYIRQRNELAKVRKEVDGYSVFFLTGCASGMGKHLATVLLSKGKTVIATDINLNALQDLKAREWAVHEDRLQIRMLDVRVNSQWREVFGDAVKQFGGVDVVMNIAGYLKPGAVHLQTEDEVHRHMDINIKGVIFGSQVAAEFMLKRGQPSHIINLGSLASISCVSGIGLYSASKHAVRAFSRVLSDELKSTGVYVTVLCPDAVQTPMLDLQLDYKEAALVFSGTILTLKDIENAVFDVILPQRPRELVIPFDRSLIAWAGELLPDALTNAMRSAVEQVGLKRQSALAAAKAAQV